MKNLQEIIYNEIDLKVQDSAARIQNQNQQLGQQYQGILGSRMITDNSINNTQYKKILELMLDLEKKTDK